MGLLWGVLRARTNSVGHTGFPRPGDSNLEKGTRKGSNQQAGQERPTRCCHVCWQGTGSHHP